MPASNAPLPLLAAAAALAAIRPSAKHVWRVGALLDQPAVCMHYACMPALQIRDVPPELYEALKRSADAEFRSLAQQAVVLLKRALSDPRRDTERRRLLVKAVRATPIRVASGAPSPTEMVRDDRRR